MKTYCIKNNRIQGYWYDLDMLKARIQQILNTPVAQFEIYDWNFGNEALGAFHKNDLERYIKQALQNQVEIHRVYDFVFDQKENYLLITFCIDTIYGSMDSEVKL